MKINRICDCTYHTIYNLYIDFSADSKKNKHQNKINLFVKKSVYALLVESAFNGSPGNYVILRMKKFRHTSLGYIKINLCSVWNRISKYFIKIYNEILMKNEHEWYWESLAICQLHKTQFLKFNGTEVIIIIIMIIKETSFKA